MTLQNWPKLVGVLVALAGLFTLVGLGRIEFNNAEPFLYLLVGYLVGNGVAAKTGDDAQPIIGSKRKPDDGTGGSS